MTNNVLFISTYAFVSVNSPPSTDLSLNVSVLGGNPRFSTSACSHAPIFPTNIPQHTPKHLAKGSNLFFLPPPNQKIGVRMCACACDPRISPSQSSSSPDRPNSRIKSIGVHILPSFPHQSPSDFHASLTQSLTLPVFVLFPHSHDVLDADPAAASSRHPRSASISARVRV